MGLYKGDSTVYPEQIYQFEETDLVVADVDNVPLQNLADRTEWLRANSGIVNRIVTGEIIANSLTTTIDSSAAGKVVHVGGNATGTNYSLKIGDNDNFPPGTILYISSTTGFGSVVTLECVGEVFFTGTFGTRRYMYMHNNEYLIIAKSGANTWRTLFASPGMFSAGEELKARKVLDNTLKLNGQYVNLLYYPRLKEFTNTLTWGREIVDAATWLGNSIYRGLFGLGTGTQAGWLYLPDERGTFDRMLDEGRGYSLNRTWSFAGGYEGDQVGAFSFNVVLPKGDSYNGNPYDSSRVGRGQDSNPRGNYSFAHTVNAGKETAVKNIGKYNLIRI